MAGVPTVTKFLDEEERALALAVEDSGYQPGESQLTPERKAAMAAYARATINAKRVKVSIRVPEDDLARLKARALREGIPYQTLINSILHKEVS